MGRVYQAEWEHLPGKENLGGNGMSRLLMHDKVPASLANLSMHGIVLAKVQSEFYNFDVLNREQNHITGQRCIPPEDTASCMQSVAHGGADDFQHGGGPAPSKGPLIMNCT